MAWKSSLLAFVQIGRKLSKMWTDLNFARKESVAFTALIFTTRTCRKASHGHIISQISPKSAKKYGN